MNKDNAKDFLPLVQALADGKELQLNVGTREKPIWDYCANWSFEGNPDEYRIKPEPREWEMVVGNDGALYRPELCRPFAQTMTIRVREILD